MTSIDLADRNDPFGRVQGREVQDQLCGGAHRVAVFGTHGRVAARAFEREAQFVVGGHVLARAEAQRARVQSGFDVLADDGQHRIAFEGVFGQHFGGSAGIRFLSGLEDSEKSTLEIPLGGEPEQGAVEHRCVDVVPAGVHHSVVLGTPRRAALFADGQGVDVGSQHDGSPQVAASFDFGQYAGSGDRTAGDACLAERLGDEAGALRFAERKLRVAVQVAAKLYGCHG